MCVALVACAAATSSAYGSIGLKSFTMSFNGAPPAGSEPGTLGPPDLQAGSHPYQFTASFAFNTITNPHGQVTVEESVKDMQIELPQGMAGNPTATPQCSMVEFASGGLLGSGGCPADTQVGTITLDGVTLDVTLPIFNLVPSADAAAQFGVNALAPIVMDLAVDAAHGYGFAVDLHDVSQALPLAAASMTLWGVPAEAGHNPFRGKCLKSNGTTEGECPSGAPVEPLLTMPTSCGEPLAATLVADSWENPGTQVERSTTTVNGTVSTGLSGCDRLRFEPTVAVQPESSAADSPTGLSVGVSIPYLDEPGGLAEAGLKALSVVLPPGLSINPATAAGLASCSPAQIGLGTDSEPSCPAASKVGVMEVESPVLHTPLHGSIYIAEPPPGLFAGTTSVYVAGVGDGVVFKLPAQLGGQPGGDQLSFTVDNVPELPLSEMRFDLFGGPRAPLATPPECGTFSTTAELTRYSAPESGLPDTQASSFAIDEGCGGGFAPSLTGGASNAVAGQSTAFTLRLARSDGQQYIQSFAATLPPGELANLNAISQCGDAAAQAGTCPAASELGTLAVGAGAGPDPYYLNGRAYLTGPYNGAPYGVSIVIPASAGPFDLGTVVVRGEVTLNFLTARLTIVAGPFPTTLGGIALRIKDVSLTVRPGLVINPTQCTPQAIEAVVGSAEGATVTVAAPFRVVGCARLRFAPTIAAAAEAPASRTDGVGIGLTLTYPRGVQANTRSIAVELPAQLGARLTTIQHTCRANEFAISPTLCPQGARVGSAAVRSTILPAPLTGSIYLVTGPGLLPRLAMALQGDGVTVELEGSLHIAKTGVTSAVFDGMPDVPLSSLEIALPRGPHSALGSRTNICVHQPTLGYLLTGYNGARVKHSVRLAVRSGCSRRRAMAGVRRGGR